MTCKECIYVDLRLTDYPCNCCIGKIPDGGDIKKYFQPQNDPDRILPCKYCRTVPVPRAFAKIVTGGYGLGIIECNVHACSQPSAVVYKIGEEAEGIRRWNKLQVKEE